MPNATENHAKILVACTALLTIACGKTTPPDSATATFNFDPAAPVVSLDPAAPSVWSFGGLKATPDSELNTLTGIVELGDGRILLTAADRVRLFDGNGTELWRFGRAGAGPEDFAMVGWPCRIGGDTIAAFDQRNNRFAFIVPTVGVVATIPAAGFSVREAACNGHGTMVMSRHQFDSTTATLNTEFWLRGGPGSDSTLLAAVPTPPPGTVGAGRPMAGVVGDLIYVTDPNAGTITLFDQAGQRVRQLQSGDSRTPVTDQNIPRRYGNPPSSLEPEQLEAWWDEIRSRPRLDNWPAFGDVAAYDSTHLWIFGGPQLAHDSITTWIVGVDGTVANQLHLARSTPGYRVGVMGILPSGIALVSTDSAGAVWVNVVERPR